MDMNLTNFWFFVIPGWFCLVGALFCLIFGPHLLQMYREHAAAEDTEAWRSLAHKHIEPEPQDFTPRAPQKGEKELVGTR